MQHKLTVNTTHNVFYFYFIHIKREWYIFLIKAVLLVVMLMTQFESMRFNSPFSTETAKLINDITFVITSSFFVGVCTYCCTVIMHSALLHKSLCYEILENFRAIKDKYRDMSSELASGNWLEDHSIKNEAIRFITTSNVDKDLPSIYINKLLNSFAIILDELYNSLVPYYSYFSFKTIKQLTEIRTSKSMQRIRKLNESNELLNHETAKKIINELVSHNEKINNIYNNLQKLYLK